MEDRREFLKRIARGAVYAAPVVVTLATPARLPAIVTTGMMIMLPFSREEPAAPAQEVPGSTAPWTQDAPWSAPADGGSAGGGSADAPRAGGETSRPADEEE